jgi:hypothetical protein
MRARVLVYPLNSMPAFTSKTDIGWWLAHVRFVPFTHAISPDEDTENPN